MNAEWVRSPSARRILVHWADARPAWLWSADGATLIWRNAAARYFNARIKKNGPRLAPDPIPIKGQVQRLIRLGMTGRSSLSRLQFLSGERPVSTTCAVTPLLLAREQMGVLVVGVDPIPPDLLALRQPEDDAPAELLPPDDAWLLLSPDGTIVSASLGAADRFGGALDRLAATPAGGATELELAGQRLAVVRFKASPTDHQLFLIEGEAPRIADIRAEDGVPEGDAIPAGDGRETASERARSEPLLPMGLPDPVEEQADQAPPPEDAAPPEAREGLLSLFDRLADHDALFGELSDADDEPRVPPLAESGPSGATSDPASIEAPASVKAPADPGEDRPSEAGISAEDAPAADDVIAAVIAFADDPEDLPPATTTTHRVTGRGFTPLSGSPEGHSGADLSSTESRSPPAPDAENVERVSRYNFDELSRILTDRVAGEAPAPRDSEPEDGRPERRRPATVPDGALINIAAETFILNRLPLGIMVFRDQQVLFANRALTDLVAYDTIDRLRAAGIAAIFPAEDQSDAGPVTHLVRHDGTRIPVTARLQSITWQGRPALMLSASPTEQRMSHEIAVRTFAEALADTREEGFVLADRAGTVTMLSPDGRKALGRTESDPAGEPLASLVHTDDIAALREFLERPARFAETARPSITLRAAVPRIEIFLFAEGQAGIVAGYFGFIHRRPPVETRGAPAPAADPDESIDPSVLARVSRGVRRPLNTIIGFADLIRSAAFGTLDNHRYLEYARDIRTAGQEIAVLVDELDDYTRLRGGRYATRPAELDLTGLLESCVVRVRGQAGAARVLVRSAISENLPHIRADRSSLGQAILNLLSSAIDQTPAGGSVVLSAQAADDGGVLVNVRDNGAAPADPGERFVVFRDGVGKDGEALSPVRSSVGLALTRSLIGVNGCTLSVDPAGTSGTLFSLTIPPDLVASIKSA